MADGLTYIHSTHPSFWVYQSIHNSPNELRLCLRCSFCLDCLFSPPCLLLENSAQVSPVVTPRPPPPTHTSCLKHILMPDCRNGHAHCLVSTDQCRHCPAIPCTGSLNSHNKPIMSPFYRWRSPVSTQVPCPRPQPGRGSQHLDPNLPGWLLPFHAGFSGNSLVYPRFSSQALRPTSSSHSKLSNN